MANPNESEIVDFMIDQFVTITTLNGYPLTITRPMVVFGSTIPSGGGADLRYRLGFVPRGLNEEFLPSMHRRVEAEYELTIEASGVDRRDAFAKCSDLRRCINRLLVQNNSQDGWAFQTDNSVRWQHLEVPEAARWAMARNVTVKWDESAAEI